MNILKLIFTLTLITLSSNANANYRGNCSSHQLGWNFYCDKEIAVNEEKKPQITTKKDEYQPLTLGEIATAKSEEIRKKHQELLDIATHFPTEENIINYIKFNQEILDKSSYFGEMAQRAIWQTPDINYSLKRPVNSIGKQVWIEERNKNQIQTARNLNERYGVFFFYRSDCPYCHAYSPTLKAFANQYGIEVMAVSLNGGILKDWPDSQMDRGQAEKMGISAVPATILFDKETSQVVPVGFGALSHQELLEQIYLITQIEVGDNL